MSGAATHVISKDRVGFKGGEGERVADTVVEGDLVALAGGNEDKVQRARSQTYVGERLKDLVALPMQPCDRARACSVLPMGAVEWVCERPRDPEAAVMGGRNHAMQLAAGGAKSVPVFFRWVNLLPPTHASTLKEGDTGVGRLGPYDGRWK